MTSISKHKILVVDDDPDILNFIKHDFAPFPVEVVTCSTIEETLEKLGEDIFTLAIIDIVMGEGLSSEKILKFVKEDFAGINRDLPIAVMSAHMNDDYAKKLRLKGSNVFATFKKPLQLKSFAAQVLGEGQRTVLLLEDDSDIVSLIKNELEQGDFQVFSCSHTDLAKRVIDLVFVNIMVIDNKLGEGKDSRGFIAYLEKDYRDLPFILTGKDIPEDLQKNESLNLIGLLNKPIQKGSLLKQINSYFNSEECARVTGGSIDDHGEDHSRVSGGASEDYGEGYSRVTSNEWGGISEELTMVSGGGDDESAEVLKVKSLPNDLKNEKSLGVGNGDINYRNENGQTPLMRFCYLGDLEKVKAMIREGADVRLKSKNGKTCLHYAAFSGNRDLLTYLVENHSIRINERDGNKCTPLFDAIKAGELCMVQTCIELGARLTFFLEGKSYLTFAVLYGYCDIAKYLIDLGLDRNKKDYKSMSPLDYALKSGKKEMIELMRL